MHEKVSPALNGLAFRADGEEFTTERWAEAHNFVPPRHVIIGGIGRGGTTAIAGLFQAFGFSTVTPNAVLESDMLRKLVKQGASDEILSAVRCWDEQAKRMFWKEPKLRSPKLVQSLKELPESVGFVFVFRDILNISIRNNAIYQRSVFEELALTLRTQEKVLQVIRLLSARKVALVSYEKLLQSSETVVRGLARFFGVADEASIEAAINSVEPNSHSYRSIVQAKVLK